MCTSAVALAVDVQVQAYADCDAHNHAAHLESRGVALLLQRCVSSVLE